MTGQVTVTDRRPRSPARCIGSAKTLLAAAALFASTSFTAAAATAGATPSREHVAALLEGDFLTLTASNASWPTVVRELAGQTGIALRVGPLPAGTVTLALDHVEIKHALRLLFGPDASLVFVYRDPSCTAGTAALDEVWIALDGAAALPARPYDQAHAVDRDPPVATAPAHGIDAVESRVGDRSSPASRPLDDPDPLVRQAALDAVVERGDGSGVEEILHVLLDEQHHEVRTRAVKMLGRLGTPEALEALSHALKDSETTVRLTAVDAIASFETRRAGVLLRDALRDRDDQVRSVAAGALHARRGRGL